MDSAVVEHRTSTPSHTASEARRRPRRAEAEAAVRTLIEWAGDDPDREGLQGTPDRVVRAYEEFFAGYAEDPVALLATTFEKPASYDEMIVLRDIPSSPIASTTSFPSWARRISVMCRQTASSGVPSWRALSRCSPSGCRSRRR